MDMMPDGDRYARMPLRRTGRSGLMLPAMSLMINRRPLLKIEDGRRCVALDAAFTNPLGPERSRQRLGRQRYHFLDVAYAKEDLEGPKLTAWTTTRSGAQMPGSWLGPDHPSSERDGAVCCTN